MKVQTFTREGLTQRFIAVDLTREGDAAWSTLAAFGPVAVVYSDPPWNPGNEKYWRRYADVAPPKDYRAFLDAWCRAVVACAPRHVFCEQSVNDAHRQMMLDAIARCPGWTLPLVEQWTVRYGSPKRPNVLLHFGPAPLGADPSGLSGDTLTRTVFKALALPRGATIADPCMGLGTTSRMAAEFGLNCLGTELNPDRLAQTTAWLTKHGFSEVQPLAPELERAPVAPTHPGARGIEATVTAALEAAEALPEGARVAIYNATQRALGRLVADVCPDPAAAPQLVAPEVIDANDYNPNRVASVEMRLLEQSILADGITMAIVTMRDPVTGRWTVVDGFHRRTVGTRLGRRYLPCAVIDRPLADRMASTVRHNRARGKHQVEIMASLVTSMRDLGWSEARIAESLGMSPEEHLRLQQMAGAAARLAAPEYSRAWGRIDAQPAQAPDEESAP